MARILVICDVENLSNSAWELGYRISYKNLAFKLTGSANQHSLHAFFCEEANDNTRTEHFESCGWLAHPQPVETVYTYQGMRTRANSLIRWRARSVIIYKVN